MADFAFGMDENISLGMDSSNYDYDLSDAFKYPIQIEIFISLFVWSVSLLTVIGNTLVFASFARDPELRAKVSNLFILNLALADFIVGTVSLPLSNLWRHYGNWPFGETICKFWMIFNYTACTQSAIAIMLISLDRYLMVAMKLRHRTFMDRWKAGFSIVFTWLTSFIFFTIPFIAFDTQGPGSWVNYSVTCDVAVLYFLPYIIACIIYIIFLPASLLIFFNLKLFFNIRKRSRGLLIHPRQVAPLNTVADQRQEHLLPSQSKDCVSEPKGTEKGDTTMLNMKNKTGGPGIQANSEHDYRDAPDYNPRNDGTLTEHNGSRDVIDDKRGAIPLAQYNSNRNLRVEQGVAIQRAASENRRALKKDRKAATTLSVLVIVYLLCWLPYCITTLIYFFGFYISLTAWNIVYYLVWLNSGLNPCLYAITNPKFRKNFLDLLFIWKTACQPR